MAAFTIFANALSAQVRFDVSGQIEGIGRQFVVRVGLHNREDTPAFDIRVDGELAGEFDRVVLDASLPGRGSSSVTLRFPGHLPRPGLHALILRVDFHSGEPPAAQGSTPLSQLAFLLFPIGGQPTAALGLEVEPAKMGVRGTSFVRVQALDGAAHRVELRVYTALGLAAYPDRYEAQLPPGGEVRIPVHLYRSGAPPGTRHGFLVEARVLDEALERTTVAAGMAEVGAEPTITRRLQWPLGSLAAACVIAALLLEGRRARGDV
ncbi:MAG TPA: hypothetical protein VGB13_08825 [Candidatus Krumholzibacteria bacterium]|jgi:hypothetical protein